MSPRRIATSLGVGVKFAVAGGRGGWARAVMTAVGVGLGVALLLTAASIPHMLRSRSDRGFARSLGDSGEAAPRSDHSLVVAEVSTEYRDALVYGVLVRPDGDTPALPPGLRALPGPGEMVVSPALRRLLDSDSGALLRDRLPYRSVGTIADNGLLGPDELAYYAGNATLTDGSGASRIDHFGAVQGHAPLSSILVLLVLIGFVILLVPVAVFVGAAVRFGSDGRDRRLAALRLIGADRAMARWISAGEALAGSVLGVLVGGALLLVFRQVVPHLRVWGVSVFGADVQPDPVLAALVVVVIPALAVLVTLLALRRVSIEPLGVVRRGTGVRRRIWWRLLIPAAGLLVLYPTLRQMRNSHSDPAVYPVAAGVTLFLVGVTTLLPWLVEAVVRRLRGGSVSWQLATRRLQLDSGTAARLVSGIAVAVAGGIGLQMLFSGVQGGFVQRTGQDPSRAQVMVTLNSGQLDGDALRNTAGVRSALVFSQDSLTVVDKPDTGTTLVVGDCASLAQLAVLDGCRDGDVFLVPDTRQQGFVPVAGTRMLAGGAGPQVPGQPAPGVAWTVPATARSATARPSAAGVITSGVFATPAALHGIPLGAGTSTGFLTVDVGDADALERIRNTAAAQSPLAQVMVLSATRVDSKFAEVRRGLFLGVVAMLLLIGASLLVSMLEQLAQRRRLLSMLVAVGTRRATLGWSVLWQAAIPMLLGLVLAVLVGTGLGSLLLAMVRSPVRVDWVDVGGIVGAAALVVLLVTGLSLPVLHRLMRTGGLRTE